VSTFTFTVINLATLLSRATYKWGTQQAICLKRKQ